ncbi:MAG: enoyl-CoA hydratase/isomerase family protein [Desulfobacterales bacterium]
MPYETLVVDRKDTVQIITLHRPERLNTINMQFMADIQHAVAEAAENDAVRSVVITGAGRAFCAGADLSEIGNAELLKKNAPRYTFFNQIEDCPKPVVAAVNGHCIGGGLELALCCDFIIAAETARMGLTEARLGIIPLAGGTVRLPRWIGLSRAKELLYTGDRIDGRTAYAMGLASRVVAPEKLMDEALAFCSRFAHSAPLSIKTIKTLIHQGLQMDIMSALDFERKAGEALIHTEDHREGITAFFEKREPLFRNR